MLFKLNNRFLRKIFHIFDTIIFLGLLCWSNIIQINFMASILRTTPSYEQLIEELDNLKKKVVFLEKTGKDKSEDLYLVGIQEYPTLQKLASGSGISIHLEGESIKRFNYNAEISDLRGKLSKEKQEKESLLDELSATKFSLEEIKIKHAKSKKRSEKLYKITKQLKTANADLENFIYSASHDLRSPISNLEGLIQILKNELGDKIGAPELTLVQMITKSITRFKQTIFDLTELSTFQKQIEEAKEPVILEEVFEDVITSIANNIEESGAEIKTDFKVSEIKFARKNLRSIIFNLLINAVKYRSTTRPLKIKISSRKKGNAIFLEIEDNGLGFLPEQKEKMFQMFKRLHSHVDGTGVGLYIVKKIAENSGGRIEVESELDKGSKFKIFFKA